MEFEVPIIGKGAPLIAPLEDAMDKDELARSVDEMLKDLPEPKYVPYVDQRAEVAGAMLNVLARRLGPDFVNEVRDEIRARALRCEKSDDSDDRADAPLLREFADDDALWARVGLPFGSAR